MTELSPEDQPETAIDPKTLRPLARRDFKEVVRLRKGVSKFLRYHRDLIDADDLNQIATREETLQQTLSQDEATRADLEAAANALTEKCEKSVPNYKYSAIRENIEVLFVAIVLAMSIRAYFGQPSRIPTGSMQPTLNGIIAYPTPETASPDATFLAPENYERPGVVKRVFDKIWHGRTHVEMISDRDDSIHLHSGSRYFERLEFKLFPRTTLITSKGQQFVVPGTKGRVQQLLNRNIFSGEFSAGIARVEEGDIIARGYIDTGDWVIVDRFTYHWRMPKRGDVFVFNTRGIRGTTRAENGDPEHYIKRLVGVPGDELEIEPPRLFVNGKAPVEPGILRVMSAENGYPGYQLQGRPENYTPVPPGQYVAFGDNSAGSSDSRDWGFVPAENIVGRAFCVYYPFGNHFGFVD